MKEKQEGKNRPGRKEGRILPAKPGIKTTRKEQDEGKQKIERRKGIVQVQEPQIGIEEQKDPLSNEGKTENNLQMGEKPAKPLFKTTHVYDHGFRIAKASFLAELGLVLRSKIAIAPMAKATKRI